MTSVQVECHTIPRTERRSTVIWEPSSVIVIHSNTSTREGPAISSLSAAKISQGHPSCLLITSICALTHQRRGRSRNAPVQPSRLSKFDIYIRSRNRARGQNAATAGVRFTNAHRSIGRKRDEREIQGKLGGGGGVARARARARYILITRYGEIPPSLVAVVISSLSTKITLSRPQCCGEITRR